MHVGFVSNLFPYLRQCSELRQNHAGSIFRSFMQRDGRVEIDAEGWGAFSCFANHVQVWVPLLGGS